MMRSTLARLRHPLAALLGVSGIVVGTVAAIGTPASAAGDELTGTVAFDCVMGAFPAYPWTAEVTLSAVRPAGSTTVTVLAHTSKMAGKSPAPLDYDATTKLTLELAGEAVVLEGAGKVVAEPNAEFDLPDTRNDTFDSAAADVAAEVTSFEFALGGLAGVCTPTSGAALGTLTIVDGTPPPLPTTPTTTTTATQTPSPSSSPSTTPTDSAAGKGKPAKGTATFACTLLGSEFDYDARISVSGYREDDDVSLVASMSDLPGKSPVEIVGSMDYTLDAEVGGKKVTLESTGDVNAKAYEKVPVEDLRGTVAAEDDDLEVAVTAFAFDFPSAGVSADCTVKRTVLGTMTVGTEPVEDDDDSTGGTSTGAPVTGDTSTGSLPKTGGGDALPVVALWAAALVLLGAAGLLCVPQVARRRN